VKRSIIVYERVSYAQQSKDMRISVYEDRGDSRSTR